MINIWVCLKMVSTPKPNGFADHYPYEKWLAIIGDINPTFSDKPKSLENTMIVIWTIEFTSGSFTKMELYGSKKGQGRVRPKMRSTPKRPFQ